MKRILAAIFATSAMAFGAVQAQECTKSATETHQVAELNAEESAFSSKLDDSHKALFSCFNAEQRQKAMHSSAQPNDAVQSISKETIAQK